MARIRQIKPEFYLDDELAQCSRDARLLFPGLWMLADRAGRLENRPAKIKAQIFPYDSDIDAAETAELLAQLLAHRFILIYEVNGKSYIQIRTFEKHQHCHRNEQPSQIPAPNQDRHDEQCAEAASTPERNDSNPQESGADSEHSGKIPSTRDTYTYTSTNTSTDTSTSAADAAVSKTPEVLVEIYKAENKVLPQVLEFTQERRKQCRTRLARDPGKFLDHFTRAVIKAQETPFLRGEGSTGWKADFDWFIANDRNVVKVLEGKYDNHSRAGPGSDRGSVFQKLRQNEKGGNHGSDRVA